MVDSYLSTKFGVNLLNGFSENAFYGRWTDAHAMALALLYCVSRANAMAQASVRPSSILKLVVKTTYRKLFLK